MRIPHLFFCCLLCLCVVSSSAQDENIPKNVAEYLARTHSEAITPLITNDGKPRPELVFGGMDNPLQVGMLGTICSFKILQIIDERTFRADVSWQQPVAYKVEGPLGKVFFRLKLITHPNVVIAGISTDGRIDGQEVELAKPSVFVVAGTKKYATVDGGTRTVFEIRPFDISPFQERFEQDSVKRIDAQLTALRKANEAKKAEKTDAAIKSDLARIAEIDELLFRKWVDSSDRFTTKGRLLSYDRKGGTVVIQKEDKTEITVKFVKLGRDDRTWILESGRSLLDESKMRKFRVEQLRNQ